MTVTAKFRCESFELFGQDCRVVKMRAVYDSDPEGPNASWSKWTPNGDISMSITNSAAYEQFEVGKSYLLTFTPAD